MKNAIKEFLSKEKEYKGKGQYKRGQIYMLDRLNDVVGDKQFGNRPVLIVSNDVGNYHSYIKEVVPLTTKIKPKLPTHVLINSAKEESTALCEQILRVDDQRLGEYVGDCSAEEMQEINEALAVSVGIGVPKQIIDTKGDPVLEKAMAHINEILKAADDIQGLVYSIEELKKDNEIKFGSIMDSGIVEDINQYIEKKIKDNLQYKYDIIRYLISGKKQNDSIAQEKKELKKEKNKPVRRLTKEQIEEIRYYYIDEHKTMEQVANDTGIPK